MIILDQMNRICYFLSTLMLIFFSVACHAAEESDFLVITDIHFDPFFSCYRVKTVPCPLIQRLRKASPSEWDQIFSEERMLPSTYWQDSNHALFSSALSAASNAAKAKPVQFVLSLGDQLAHDFHKHYRAYSQDDSRVGRDQFTRKTLAYMATKFAQAFPAQNIYSLLGNNDSYGGNYYSNPNGMFYSDTSVLWSRLIRNAEEQAVMRREFREAGYYALTLNEVGSLRLIAMNTVLFSNKARGKKVPQAAEVELDWLHSQLELAKANHQPVLIAMHIPEGIDVLSLFKLPIPLVSDLWRKEYMNRFDAEIKAYASSIVGVFSGHVHSGCYQLLRFNDLSTIPWVGVPSVSPVYGNHPSFKTFRYSLHDHRVSELGSYYFSLLFGEHWHQADSTLNHPNQALYRYSSVVRS